MVGIKEIGYGIACRIGNIIYIHKGLKKYPKLRANIILHELEHSPGYTKKDFVIDITNENLKGLKKDYYSFVFTHPSSWIEFLPFWFYKKNFVFNPNLALFWVIFYVVFQVMWDVAK